MQVIKVSLSMGLVRKSFMPAAKHSSLSSVNAFAVNAIIGVFKSKVARMEMDDSIPLITGILPVSYTHLTLPTICSV